MSYATPAAYFSAFGLTEAVQLLGDEEQLLTAQLLQDAVAVLGTPPGAWTGSPTPEEQAAGLAAAQRLLDKLAAQSNFMDGYLRSQVELPLPPESANAGSLQECCLALTRCAIADDAENATERMDKAADVWRKWLADVAAGRVTLVTPGTGATPVRSGGARTGQATSAYDWSSFGAIGGGMGGGYPGSCAR